MERLPNGTRKDGALRERDGWKERGARECFAEGGGQTPIVGRTEREYVIGEGRRRGDE